MGANPTQPRKRVRAVQVKAFNTQYAAATDGYVKAYDTNVGGSISAMQLLCDTGNPPTIVRDQFRDDDGNTLGGVSLFVARGENWRVNWGYTGVVLWRPHF